MDRSCFSILLQIEVLLEGFKEIASPKLQVALYTLKDISIGDFKVVLVVFE